MAVFLRAISPAGAPSAHNAQANLDKLGHVERPARQPLLERLAVEQLHGEKRRVGADVVDSTEPSPVDLLAAGRACEAAARNR